MYGGGVKRTCRCRSNDRPRECLQKSLSTFRNECISEYMEWIGLERHKPLPPANSLWIICGNDYQSSPKGTVYSNARSMLLLKRSALQVRTLKINDNFLAIAVHEVFVPQSSQEIVGPKFKSVLDTIETPAMYYLAYYSDYMVPTTL